MQDVSTYKAFGIYLIKLKEAGIPTARLVEGFPVRASDLTDKKHRMDWNLFASMTRRFSDLIGGYDELVSTGHLPARAKPAKVVGSIMTLLREPKQLYRAMVRMVGPAFFNNLDFKLEDVGKSLVRVTIEIPEGYDECREFFYIYKGVYETLPVLLNQPFAVVEAKIAPRRGEYLVTLPPSTTIVSRAKLALSAFSSAKGIVDELAIYQEQIRKSYEGLEQANRRLHDAEVKLQLQEQVANLSQVAAVYRLAGGVGHEINNPLMTLLMNTDLIADMVKSGDVDKKTILKRLHAMKEANERIARVTNALRDMGAYDLDAKVEDVVLSDILDDVKNLSASHFLQHHVRLDVTPLENDIKIRVRSAMFKQSLLHLLNNAFDAALEGQERWIRIDVESDGRVKIMVTDSGPGIPKAIRGAIFNPFFTTKEVGKGAGLGLSLAKKYLQMDGADLKLDTSCEHTCFSFDLERA